MFGVELARLYASVTSEMPSTAASTETRTNPVSRESSVPAPTTTLERARDRVLGPGSVVMTRGSRGERVGARLPAPAPVGEPPDCEEEPGAGGEEHAHPAQERRSDGVPGPLEVEAVVGRADGDEHREGARRPRLHVELGRGVAGRKHHEPLRPIG